jgi:hypothetical protein
MLHPITFSIPREKIIKETDIDKIISGKTKLLSSLIPGRSETYIYNTEESYYNEYRISFFATTTKKAGWDCLRHYEILANACIPFFPDIEKCNYNTLALFPKSLIMKGNLLYQKMSTSNVDKKEELDEYKILLIKLLNYTKEYLTTDKIAKYVLEKSTSNTKSTPENISKILYLSGDVGPDYLRCLTLHGFKTLFGENCHDYPKIPHIYEGHGIHSSQLYGKGFTYTGLIRPQLHNDAMDKRIEENIKNKYYDIVIYGSYHRGIPLYDLVSSVYNRNEIILFCGEDIHKCNYPYCLQEGHTVFVREI